MFDRDSRTDPRPAPAINAGRARQPYARRTISVIFVFAAVLIAAGAFIGWHFFTPSGDSVVVDKTKPTLEPVARVQPAPSLPGNNYKQGSARGGVYNFFYKMFGGIEDGLEDNSLSQKIAQNSDELNLSDQLFDEDISPALALQRQAKIEAAQHAAENQDDYRHSVFDVVGSEVHGRKGNKAGEVHDIIVNKQTGEAKAIIVNDDDARYERDLTAIRFKRVRKQQQDGDVMLTITEDRLEEAPDFLYSSIDDTNLVSLRTLRDGQLLDFEGKVAGQVDAVIYENAEAQNIYFTLRPVLAQHGIPKFGLPFEEVNIIEGADGYDIQLTKEQTAALAEMMFQDEDK